MECIPLPGQNDGCPVCRAPAPTTRIDERNVTLVECDDCTTFTITDDRTNIFAEPWRIDDRETVIRIEHLSRYLRLGGDDCDREVTPENRLSLAIEGGHMDDE